MHAVQTVNLLSDLAKVKKRARVVQVTGSDAVSTRLLEMGLVPGSELKLVGVAPLGDPLEFEVRGYHLSLRKSEASRVEIELID